MADCVNREKNVVDCTCSYMACERRGICCECVAHHRAHGQLPGCLFPADAEKTYDRSVRKYVEVMKDEV